MSGAFTKGATRQKIPENAIYVGGAVLPQEACVGVLWLWVSS